MVLQRWVPWGRWASVEMERFMGLASGAGCRQGTRTGRYMAWAWGSARAACKASMGAEQQPRSSQKEPAGSHICLAPRGAKGLPGMGPLA